VAIELWQDSNNPKGKIKFDDFFLERALRKSHFDRILSSLVRESREILQHRSFQQYYSNIATFQQCCSNIGNVVSNAVSFFAV